MLRETPYDPIGLCRVCRNARPIPHPRGGEPYWRCGLSESNPAYARFPRLPVLRCPGHVVGEPQAGDVDASA